MSFLNTSKVLLPVSVLLMVVSAVLLFYPAPRLSIEFTGGTLMEFDLPEAKTKDDLLIAMRSFEGIEGMAESTTVSQTSAGTSLVRTITLLNEDHAAVLAHLKTTLGEELTELQFTTIGPTVGQSLKERSIWALIIATIAIVLYLALVFRRVPGKLSPWSFGLAAVVALTHDTLITVGIFTILSYTTSFQLDTLFVTALLSIMGYSVNDTIVIFDRIRSNLFLEGQRADLPQLIERSLWETLTRTINTGAGALIMLFVLFFFASESIRWFVLTMIVGTLIGTYSSFFIAAPLLLRWKSKDRR